jgi:hypothetical protein
MRLLYGKSLNRETPNYLDPPMYADAKRFSYSLTRT